MFILHAYQSKKSTNKYYAPLARAGSRISRPLPVLARADPRVDPRVDPGVDPSMDNSNSDMKSGGV